MHHISENTDPPLPLSCLRLLVPPLRLISALIWQTVQQKVVANYGLLDDFVTAVIKIVPELLNQRQRSLLRLGLRAQLTLELCRSEQTIDLETIQPHLDIFTSLWDTEISGSGDESSASNLLDLIHTLITDQEQRRHFFQDVFPARFGDKYSEDIQMLVEIFLLQLDKLVTVPNLKQVAPMISNIPSALSECVRSFCQSQELKSLLEYQKDRCQLHENDNPTVGASISSALRLPHLTTVSTEQDEKPLEANVLTDYMDAFNKELTVESPTQGNGVDHVEIESDKLKKQESEASGSKNQSHFKSEGLENEGSSLVQHIESLDEHKIEDSCAVEVQVGYNVEILAEESISSENQPSVEASMMNTKENEQVQVLVRPSDETDYKVTRPAETKNSSKDESKEISTSTVVDEQAINSVSNVALSPELYAPVVFASQRPVRHSSSLDQGLKMKKVSITPKNDCSERGPRVLSTSKTCPTCGKTYSRASDMRRHQITHTGERPYECSQCKKSFQFQYDLKRHESNVCRIPMPQPLKSSSKVPSDKNTQDSKQGEVYDRLRTLPLDNRTYLPMNDRTLDSMATLPLDDRTTLSLDDGTTLPLEGRATLPLDGGAILPSDDGTTLPLDDDQTHEKGCRIILQKVIPLSTKEEGHIENQSEEPHVDNQKDKTLKGFRLKKTHKHNPNDPSLCCAECNKSFPDTARLKTHYLTHKPRPCTKCGECFKGFIELNRHYVEVHDFRGPFPCTLCQRTYTDMRGLIRHERFHTGDLPFKCPKCPKAFSYPSALMLHDRTHTKETPFLCWDCGKGCKSNAALRIHRLCCHSSAKEKRFCCEHCGKAYALKRSLDLHVAKLHTGVRYPCTQCGKLFRSASSLTRHDLTHTEERPYSCNECGKSFRSASELKIHTRYHTGERPFKCQECGKGFVQSYYLTAHMRMHTGETPYRCTTCDKYFKTTGILKRHQMTHTGEKPHKCLVCEMAFNRPELARAHVRKCH